MDTNAANKAKLTRKINQAVNHFGQGGKPAARAVMPRIFAALLTLDAAPASAKPLGAETLLALHGLAGFSTLDNTPAGKTALQSNLSITHAVQTGASGQPGLQSFALQQQQALRDASITFNNGRQLTDGLGSKLGGAYQALTDYPAAETCKQKPGVGKAVTASVNNLLFYTASLTSADSGAAKLFFAAGKTDDKAGADPAVANIFSFYQGKPDVLGSAYQIVPGQKPDPLGDSRPYQTELNPAVFSGTDYFGKHHRNSDYLNGPVQCLAASPAFPSGHTTYGYTESLLFALMIPERYSQMITRGAEYGNGRIILGAHYAMDVIGGRTLAYYDIAHLLAENPAYLGQGKTPITDFAAALASAKSDLRLALAKQCGAAIASCATADTGRFNNAATNAAFEQFTLTYGLPAVYPAKPEDVAALAPEAGYLLTAAFPKLSLAQADDILTATEAPGGGFLDNGSAFGVYSRLDLVKAASQAAR